MINKATYNRRSELTIFATIGAFILLRIEIFAFDLNLLPFDYLLLGMLLAIGSFVWNFRPGLDLAFQAQQAKASPEDEFTRLFKVAAWMCLYRSSLCGGIGCHRLASASEASGKSQADRPSPTLSSPGSNRTGAAYLSHIPAVVHHPRRSWAAWQHSQLVADAACTPNGLWPPGFVFVIRPCLPPRWYRPSFFERYYTQQASSRQP
jgi:hypothetical protein